MVSPEAVAYVVTALATVVVGYAAKRIVDSADRIDVALIRQSEHEVRINNIEAALGRGRVRFSDIDAHLEATDKDVYNVRVEVARLQGSKQ